jgi:hypothetical protein
MNQLKLFADHCVSNFIIQSLREAGYEVFRLKDHLPADSEDSEVIAKHGHFCTVFPHGRVETRKGVVIGAGLNLIGLQDLSGFLLIASITLNTLLPHTVDCQ